MKKIFLFPVLLEAGCVIAGLYGALHNQISYSVSRDFFHWYMFPRFEIQERFCNRFGAALVGWYSTWWMGLCIGVPVLLVGLILPGWRLYLTRCLIAFAIIAVTAMMVGVGALTYANSYIPGHLHIERAAMMHNFSYVGGFIGIMTGSLFLILERVRLSLTGKKGKK